MSPETTVQFGILGSLRIAVDGIEVTLDSPKQRSLMAVLLIDVGRVVSTDRLAEILWRDDQPEDPSGAVHTHVSRLRALLGREGGSPARSVLLTRPPGYVLAVDPQQVDAGRFERLVADARGASSPAAAADLLEEALALWRGRPLAEFDHEFALAEAARLQELHTDARELHADALLAMGRYAEVAGELQADVAHHPFRERMRGQLMVALQRCGRPSEALAAYRDLRDLLGQELGVEPSAALRRLELAILQQDEVLPWPAPEADVDVAWDRSAQPSRRPAADPTLLPDAPTSFVGREDDVRGVTAALADGRIVVLAGVGGVGKSRLALRVARRVADGYPDGVRLCDLVGANAPEAVSDVVATVLGVSSGDQSGSEDALMEFLRAQRLLLVLDNCEHVLGGAARLVDRMVRTCPEVDVLATSRQPLGIAGQQIWPVEPLAVEGGVDGPAAALFTDRAAAADPSFDPADHPETVVEICRRLDGLPLAIELAAARVRSMTPADIAARLDRRFDLLTADARLAPSRHRSLQAVVDWSYALLPDQTRQLFDRLTVFAGGFELDAAEEVCAGDGLTPSEVAGRVAELVDHSLVVVDRSRHRARYRLLETLRTYGRTRLEERGELQTWRDRHARYFTALAGEAASGLLGPEEPRWVRILDTELADLRAAQAWAQATGQVDVALRLPALLRVYAYYRLRDEVFDWALRALDLPGACQSPAWASASVAAGVGCMQRGDLDRARHHAEQTLASASEERVVLRAHQLLAEIALYRGSLEESDRRGAMIVEQARALEDGYYQSLGHLHRVFAAAYAGRTEEALAHLEEGWQAVETTGNPTLRAGYWYLEGEVRLDADPEAAQATLERAIHVSRSVGNRFIEGVSRVAAASLKARHGQQAEALEAFREIVDHWRTSGDWAHMWTTLHNLVVLLERVGAQEPAAVLFGAAETATTGARAFGTDARRLETTAASLRASLGEEAYAAAEDRGRDMTDDEAVGHALDEIDRLLATRPVAGG